MPQPKDINLIPADMVQREKSIRRIWIWAGVIGVVLGLIFSLYVVEKRDQGAVQRVIADLNRKNQEIEEKLKRLNVLQEKRNRLARKEQAIHSLLYKRSLSGIFSELERTMNGRVWLTSLEFKNEILIAGQEESGQDSGETTTTGYFIIKDDALRGGKDSDGDARGATTLLQGMAESNDDMADFLERLSESASFSEVSLKHVRQKNFGDFKLIDFELECAL
jgi:Tfp pilus assembly protein PilN